MVLASEYRLAWALLLNAAVLACAWRFVRRRVAVGPAQTLADVLLLWCAVQYFAVGAAGLFGVLEIRPVTVVALAASALLWIGAGPVDPHWVGVPSTRRHWPVAWPAIFAAALVGAVLLANLYSPTLGDDALAYHAPAAVQWLREHKINPYQTWYFNPIDAYAPAAGSIFIAWLMAPLHSDTLSRFVQAPALVMIFALMVELGRSLGATTLLATLVAAAVVLCRPFIGQVAFSVDDLWLTAFFLAAMVALGKDRSADRLGPWRAGLALGLLLATKYGALLLLPVLLPMVDGPCAAWRAARSTICLALAALIAGPWYLRNLLTTGNPVYPIDVTLAGRTLFAGMFTTHANTALRSWPGISNVLTGTQQPLSMPPELWGALAAAWLAALAGCWRRLPADPLVRTCLLGPPLSIALFFWLSPYADIRGLYPAIVLLSACAALALATWVRQPGVAVLAAGALAAAAAATSFPAANPLLLLTLCSALTVLGAFLYLVWPALRRLDGLTQLLCAVAATLLLATFVYVQWRTYVLDCRAQAIQKWQEVYDPRRVDAWNYAREWLLPYSGVLAYANTSRVYPLTGPRRPRPVVYVPTREGVRSLRDLPHLPQPVDADELIRALACELQQHTDANAWLAGLKASNVQYLYIAKNPDDPQPPELALARAHPRLLVRLFENEAAAIYRVRE